MFLVKPNREYSSIVLCNMHREDAKCIQNFIAI